jgi:hypothetical protein
MDFSPMLKGLLGYSMVAALALSCKAGPERSSQVFVMRRP